MIHGLVIPAQLPLLRSMYDTRRCGFYCLVRGNNTKEVVKMAQEIMGKMTENDRQKL